MATVDLDQVTRAFPRPGKGKAILQVLGPVTLTVPTGEFVALLGPSGCGKSTIVHLLAGLDEPSTGTVRVDSLAPRALQARHKLGIAFQEHALLPWRSVEGNLRLPFQIAGQPADPVRIRDLIELVGLTGFERARAAQLSGGMRQRVAIARALALAPSLLLLDEPFGALDEVMRRRMNFEMERIWLASRPTCILVTHSVEEAVLLADRVLVFSERPGRIREDRRIDFTRPRAAGLMRTQAFHAIVDELTACLGPGDPS